MTVFLVTFFGAAAVIAHGIFWWRLSVAVVGKKFGDKTGFFCWMLFPAFYMAIFFAALERAVRPL